LNAVATIDHLVVTAPNLKSGVQWVRDALGVTAQLGGKHLRMGTHNCLLRLGDDAYLEIISPDPNAPDPGRPRWFDLDELDKDSQPRLAAWVVRTAAIRDTITAATEPLGVIEPMSRGDLNWLITVTDDGRLPLAGIAPVVIQWHSASHPAQRLREEGCTLLKLELHHREPARVDRLLRSIRLDTECVNVIESGPNVRPRMIATIQTPRGIQSLPTV